MIIFDLDGTLVDSAPEIAAAMDHAWNVVIGDHAFPRDRLRIGPPLAEQIAALSPELAPVQHAAIASAFRARYDATDFSLTLPYDGISDALDLLAARGTRLCVATNKRRGPTMGILRRWFPERFARIACIDGVWPDDGTRPGTKTAMLEWLAGGGRSATVMVGDTTGDIVAARAAGVRCIAVTWGYEGAANLASAQPDDLVSDVDSLLEALALEGR